MSFSLGIIGLPNVGKSTLFTALTKKQVDASNYPFCTIEPNVGIVAVPDDRLEKLAGIYQSPKIVPTAIEFVDIAGLVKGASIGEGLGNKFLSHIREVDAICEVVRDFKNDDIVHVSGRIDPMDDVKTINLELILADLETINNRLEKITKQAKSTKDKVLLKNLDILNQLKKHLEEEKFAIKLEVKEENKNYLKELNLLTYKPILYIYNVAENELTKPIPEAKTPYLTICAKLESDLAAMNDNEAKQYLDSLGIKQSGLDKLILESYNLLGLITFFTSGPKESHAWTIEEGTLAPQAAGVIHTDFEQGFIKAEIANWKDLIETGGEIQAKEKGLIKTEGKNYQIKDGDVAYFLFN